MTTPGASAPDGAYVLGSRYGSDVTEESAKAAMRGDVLSGFEAAQPNLLDLIVTQAIEWIDSMIAELLYSLDNSDFLGLFDFGGLADWLVGVDSTATDAQNAANNAKDTADSAAVAVAQQGTIITTVSSKIDTVELKIPSWVQYWSSMNLTEDVTFPRINLTTYTYEYYDQYGSYFKKTVAPFYTPTKGKLEVGVIRASYTRAYSAVTYTVGGVSGTACPLYVVVGRMLTNGDLSVEWVSGDRTPSMTGATAEWTVPLPAEIVAQGGETMFVGILQVGTGNVRPLAGLSLEDIARNSTLYPPRSNATVAGFGSAPSAGEVIAAASCDFSGLSIPYLGLGTSIASDSTAPRDYFDNFDRTTLGPSWANLSGNCWMNVDSTSAIFYDPLGYGGGTEARALWVYPLTTDRLSVSAEISTGITDGLFQDLQFAFNPSGLIGARVSVSNTAVKLQKVTGGTTVTDLATISRTQVAGEVITVRRDGTLVEVTIGDGSIDPATGAVTDPVFISYTDPGSNIPSGAGQRNTGLVVRGGGDSGDKTRWRWFRAKDI